MSDLENTDTSSGLAATEAECAEGRTAPRVSLADIEAAIAATYYSTGEDVAGLEHPGLATLTICLLRMENGFMVLGKSAPASAENFDSDLGRKLAYEDCIRQLWPLMGFELRSRLFHMEQTAGERAVANLDPMEQGGFRQTLPTAQVHQPEDMGDFFGTKRVFAKPMTRGEFQTLIDGHVLSDDEHDEPGYLVEYTDGLGKPNVEGFEGYVSWSPKAVFEASYTPSPA